MALISNLPPELLHMIFSFVVENERGNHRGSFKFRKRHGYSQVCRSWRTVALSNPDLWRNIDHYKPKRCIGELLQRSQGANLCVDFGRDAPPKRVRAIVKWHLGRIEDFRVEIERRSTVDVPSILHEGIQALSTQDLPLRVFKMGVFGSWGDPTPYPPSVFSTILDEDVASVIRRSPRLEQLALSGDINLLWDTPLPSSLTNLRLVGVNRPSLGALLDLLRQTPQLQHLDLDSCGPKDKTGDLAITPTPTSVNLPCLQTIKLMGVDLATESFFRYLNVPANKVDFQFRSRHAEPTPLPVIRYLSERFHHPDDRLRWPPIRHLSICMEGTIAEFDFILSSNPMQATNFREWKTACSKLVEHSEEDDFVCLSFKWVELDDNSRQDFPKGHLDTFLRHFPQLPLHDLQALDLADCAFESFTPGTFEELMNNLPELVYLESFVDTQLWECLERKQKRITSPNVDVLPKLRYVVARVGPGDFGDDAYARMYQALVWMEKWLSARLESTGSKLVRLEFSFTDWDIFEGDTRDFDAFSRLADVVILGK